MQLTLDGYIQNEIQIVRKTKPDPKTGVKHFSLNLGCDDFPTFKKVVDAVFPFIQTEINQGRPCEWKIRTKYIDRVHDIAKEAENMRQFRFSERICEDDKDENPWIETILHFNKYN